MKTTSKTCEFGECMVQISATPGRSIEEFNRRRFCSTSCAAKFKNHAARARLIEDVEWIVDHDHPHSVAKRVGYGKVEDLINKLQRNGRYDLANKLVRNLQRYRMDTEPGLPA